MWNQLNSESEKIKRFTWLFLACLATSHVIAIFFVAMKQQNAIFLIAITSAFFIVAQAGRIKIWLGTVSAGVIFGFLPLAQTAGSARDFSLLAWKVIMHTALGTSLALLLMAEIPFNGDASLALALDTVLMVLALVSMTYIEVETKWYPTIVRSIAVFIIVVILIEVGLGIAYPELTKSDRWWKFLEFAKNHWIALAFLIGIPLFLWRKVSLPTIPLGKLIGLLLLLFAISMAFQGPRDWLLDKVNRPENFHIFTGTEISRSVMVRTFDSFGVCDLEPNHRYTFVKATTSHRSGDPKDDNKLFPRRNKGDGEITWGSVDGRVSMEPEKLPYKDGNYHFGILANDLPPGRNIVSDAKGCVTASFNTNLIRYFEVPDPFGMAFVFRGQ